VSLPFSAWSERGIEPASEGLKRRKPFGKKGPVRSRPSANRSFVGRPRNSPNNHDERDPYRTRSKAAFPQVTNSFPSSEMRGKGPFHDRTDRLLKVEHIFFHHSPSRVRSIGLARLTRRVRRRRRGRRRGISHVCGGSHAKKKSVGRVLREGCLLVRS